MNDFLERWKTDHRYKTKIKLLLYTLFVVIVAIYAISVNNTDSSISLDDEQNITDENVTNSDNQETDESLQQTIINIPEKYNYQTNINIDNNQYQYSGTKNPEETTITKEVNNTINDYIYKDNNYYIVDEGISTITSQDIVYDVVNYNYINLENINEYLENSHKQDNQYIVYLKDIILGSDSEEYISILINDNEINIDYTSLMKYFNNDIEKYLVNIKLEEIE